MRKDVAVAASLCGKKTGTAIPTLLSIEQGQMDKGAEVIWLSQYPSQMEVKPPDAQDSWTFLLVMRPMDRCDGG
jgi:hypothetical protein